MSMMCKMSKKCCASKGMCGHEKMMLVMMVVGIPLIGHFVFNWF